MAFCPGPGQAATAALSQTQFSCPGFNSLFFWSESKLVTFEADCNKYTAAMELASSELEGCRYSGHNT